MLIHKSVYEFSTAGPNFWLAEISSLAFFHGFTELQHVQSFWLVHVGDWNILKQSDQIVIFHQPRFPWNKGSHFPSQTVPFGGPRSCEVAKIWPEQFIGASRIETTHYISFLRMISLFGPILVPFEKGPKKMTFLGENQVGSFWNWIGVWFDKFSSLPIKTIQIPSSNAAGKRFGQFLFNKVAVSDREDIPIYQIKSSLPSVKSSYLLLMEEILHQLR